MRIVQIGENKKNLEGSAFQYQRGVFSNTRGECFPIQEGSVFQYQRGVLFNHQKNTLAIQ